MKTSTRKLFNHLLFLAAISISNACFAGESEGEIKDPIAHGEEAHKNHCYKCHTDSVYTRDNRFVKSIDALSKQVLRCKEGSDVPWFDEDADAVVQFLNKKYYRF
ncbi:MAG: cytochrome c [Gammaproteobacteria bacterium]|nr:cytochrome c [Gammaproteobacteria bacterium]